MYLATGGKKYPYDELKLLSRREDTKAQAQRVRRGSRRIRATWRADFYQEADNQAGRRTVPGAGWSRVARSIFPTSNQRWELLKNKRPFRAAFLRHHPYSVGISFTEYFPYL